MRGLGDGRSADGGMKCENAERATFMRNTSSSNQEIEGTRSVELQPLAL